MINTGNLIKTNVQAELEEVKDDLKLREMKAKDCMIDASKLAEELHGEQEQVGVLENDRKLLESKLKEVQVTQQIVMTCNLLYISDL